MGREGTDTSGLAQDGILYSGREVLPIGGFLGNVPAPTLAALQADIGRGYVRVFVLQSMMILEPGTSVVFTQGLRDSP